MKAKPMNRRPGLRDERGVALITVVLFAFILTLAGASYFAMSYYETRQATYRQESTEAFYLADGAVERARGQLFADRTWRGSVTGDSLGRGTYDMTIADSTFASKPAVHILGVGHVGRAERRVEVFGEARPPFPPFLVMENLDASGGNFCLGGAGHANVEANFGNQEQHFQSGGCDLEGSYTEGFTILPPVVFTEPAYYPGMTYYYVTVVPSSPPEARIWIYSAGDTLDITDSLKVAGHDLSDHIANSAAPFEIDFQSPEIQEYLNATTGVFKKLGADSAVVVNFAAWTGTPQINVEFQDSGNNPIPTTIVNSRFTGATLEDRWDWRFWTGGIVQCKTKATFEPLNGIAMITWDFDPSNAQVKVGTPANPALAYVCRDVVRFTGGLEVNGSLMVLRNFESRGNVTIAFYPGFLDKMPAYLQSTFQPGTGILDFFVWREVAAGT